MSKTIQDYCDEVEEAIEYNLELDEEICLLTDKDNIFTTDYPGELTGLSIDELRKIRNYLNEEAEKKEEYKDNL